jgi:hypothetical protein
MAGLTIHNTIDPWSKNSGTGMYSDWDECFAAETRHSSEKSQSMLCLMSLVFSGCSGFLPQQGMLTEWVGMSAYLGIWD